MATVAQKSADLGTLIDDIKSTATGLSQFEDADSNVTNDQSSPSWRDNGAVLHHTPSGCFLTFYISQWKDESNRGKNTGIRIIESTEYDTGESKPKGKVHATSIAQYDTSGETQGRTDFGSGDFKRSFPQYDQNNSMPEGHGLIIFDEGWGNITGDNNASRNNAASISCDYFLSAGSDYLAVGAFAPNDGNYGGAASYTFEHLDEKFWNDGNFPVAIESKMSYQANDRDGHMCSYGFRHAMSGSDNDEGLQYPFFYNVYEYFRNQGTLFGQWGFQNQETNDDTFFYTKPVIYQSVAEPSTNQPVAYVESVIPNDIENGVSHGSTVNVDGKTYKVFKKRGGGTDDKPVSVGLRFE
jgi:hypothetical protein